MTRQVRTNRLPAAPATLPLLAHPLVRALRLLAHALRPHPRQQGGLPTLTRQWVAVGRQAMTWGRLPHPYQDARLSEPPSCDSKL